MATLRHSIRIDGPAAAAWRLWTDVARIPEWKTGSPRIAEVVGRGDVVGDRYAVALVEHEVGTSP